MSAASADARAGSGARLLWSRVLAATPLLAIVAWLAVIYAAQAADRVSPTLFSDELQWTQLSRSVAEDGVPSIRGGRTFFESLYVYAIAPGWWAGDTAAGYEAVKYINVLLMTAAAFPAYLLARRLVSNGAALAVATASIAIPTMVYALYVMSEVLAYPWAVLCAWLIVEALAHRTRGWIVAAVVVSLLAPLVRGQLIVIPLAFAGAAFLLWWTSARARRLRTPSWTAGDTVALGLLAVGAFAITTRFLLESNSMWQLATDTSGRIGVHVLAATAALMIGLGVLPLIAGLVGLVPRRGETLSAHHRAFVAVTVSFLVLFEVYAGFKGAYNERTFSIRINERNLFYLAPLLVLSSAIALEARRIRLVPLVLATAFATYLVVWTPIELNYPYFDAPGFSIAVMANRELFWPTGTIETALLVTVAVSAAIIAASRFLRGPAARAGLALVAVLVIAWNLTGQVTAAGGANASSRAYHGHLSPPRDWVDRATGGRSAAFLGQRLTSGDALRLNLLEFWNPSISKVGTTEGGELSPGPTFKPQLVDRHGTLSDPPGTDFLLAGAGIVPVGEPIASRGSLRLYALDGPIRLRESVTGVDAEAWMADFAGYNRFAGDEAGEVVVTLSRAAFCPGPDEAPPAPHVTVSVGALELDGERRPAVAGARWATRTQIVPNCEQRELRLPVRSTPWRADVRVDRTFKPADYGFPDTRTLGVMVAFRFEPAQGR